MALTAFVTDAHDLRAGDHIAYPATLRKEHRGERARLVVARIEEDRAIVHRVGTRAGDWDHEQDFVVFPMQLQENGVLVTRDE
jgi:hypothetical protein